MEVKKLYEGKSWYRKGKWKEDTDHIVGPEVIRGIYHELSNAGYVPPPERDFIFVSPTANIPTHEITFFHEDQRFRKGHALFLAGDISDVAVDRSDIRRDEEQGIFQYFKWDASNMPVRGGSVDMLWDRKGWLWHAAYTKRPKQFLESLENYHRLLKDNGCVVVDAIPGYFQELNRMSLSKELKNSILFVLGYLNIRKVRPAELFRPGVDQFEESTVDLIDVMGGKRYGRVWEKIDTMFDVEFIGQGVGTVCVMRKKPAAHTP